ncbi:MAG: pseudouridine synthase [Candidatus Peregrinibacteria bacterium]
MPLVRLNKHLADKGICSRRAADALIAAGSVRINGKAVTELGTKVDSEVDTVTVDEKTLEKRDAELLYIALHKPVGYVTSTKKTEVETHNFLDLLPADFPRVFPVGRLDKDSSGLLLLTNDGDLAFRLSHPKFEHEKEYEVEIYNPLTDEMLQKMRDGMYILGSKTRPAVVKKMGRNWFSIVLTEGKNRQIRRMVRALGSGVKNLKRVRIGKFRLLPTLKSGEFQQLSKKEVDRYFGE